MLVLEDKQSRPRRRRPHHQSCISHTHHPTDLRSTCASSSHTHLAVVYGHGAHESGELLRHPHGGGVAHLHGGHVLARHQRPRVDRLALAEQVRMRLLCGCPIFPPRSLNRQTDSDAVATMWRTKQPKQRYEASSSKGDFSRQVWEAVCQCEPPFAGGCVSECVCVLPAAPHTPAVILGSRNCSAEHVVSVV
jgi:hypothetical protein